MLGNGQGNARDVNFLEAVLPDEGVGHVARNGYHRDTIQHRRCNTRYEVGCARTARCQANAYFARRTRVAVRRMRRALLVRGKHVVDFIFIFVKGVVNIDDLTTRITEDIGYALLN